MQRLSCCVVFEDLFTRFLVDPECYRISTKATGVENRPFAVRERTPKIALYGKSH
jgi:hypothetical protein